jgi:hypothetical protein
MFSWKRTKAIWAKAIAFNSQPTETTFPELPQVLIWLRFVLGLLYGIFLGCKDIHSAVMILQLVNLIIFVPVMYTKLYLGVNGDAFGTSILSSGTINAIALCLLVWITIFTYNHEAEETHLKDILHKVSSSSDPPGGDASSMDTSGTAAESEPIKADSEF